MPDSYSIKKITELTANTTANDDDLFVLGNNGTAVLRKVTFANLANWVKTKISALTQSDLCNNVVTNDQYKVATAAVAKYLADLAKFELKTLSYGSVTTTKPVLYANAYIGVLNIVVQLPSGTYNNSSAMWTLPSGMTPKADFRFICDVGGTFTVFVVTTAGAIRPNSTFTLSAATWVQGEAVFLL